MSIENEILSVLREAATKQMSRPSTRLRPALQRVYVREDFGDRCLSSVDSDGIRTYVYKGSGWLASYNDIRAIGKTPDLALTEFDWICSQEVP